MGLGLAHFIPLLAYLGFWVMCVLALTGRPLWGLYYLTPFLPYRTMRDHFEAWPLGSNVLTILVICVIVGALIKRKKLPPTRLYLTWFTYSLYLYLSMWIGAALGNEPAPLWLANANFVTWKDYMILPLVFVAAGLLLEDRKSIRNMIILVAITLFLIDKSALAESLSHSWSAFNEDKRGSGPIEYGPNQLAAFLAQFAMFFWGFLQFMKRKKVKLLSYALVGLTILTTMYTFSRASYIALIASALVLGLLKDRKLLVILGVFLLTWQTVVPTAVTERVNMTHNSDGELEASAQERVDLWTQSRQMFLSSPLVGTGYASFQFGHHTAHLKDTHNWYVKVLVETGVVGGVFAIALLYQLFKSSFLLFRRARDPMYRALGLGFFLCVLSCAVANFFGDRWTYVEINGLFWLLSGAVLRARVLDTEEATSPAGLPAGSADSASTDEFPNAWKLPPRLDPAVPSSPWR